MGKIFCTILNNRITKYLEDNEILSNTQGGFRKNYRTSDNIFILKSLIQKYAYKGKSKKLFACFVDFSKAFDTIPRKLLFHKLEKVGIGGNVLAILKDMYKNTKAQFKRDNILSPIMTILNGVKQGCVLSSTLFNIYLHDLSRYLMKTNDTNPVSLNDLIAFNDLTYADDLSLLSESADGLQNCLRNLHSYCRKWGLKVNLIKTKIIIFNRGGRVLKNHTFQYNGRNVTIMDHYIYLGFKIVPSGKFGSTIKELNYKANKALFGMRRKLPFSLSESPRLSLKLFDSLIRPVLLYGVEVWGNEIMKSKIIENLHIKICKQILWTSRKASNVACLAELGRAPLQQYIIIQMVKYWTRILTLGPERLLKQAYLYQVRYHHTENNWASNLKNVLEKHGFSYIWQKQDTGFHINKFLSAFSTTCKDMTMQNQLAEINQNKKLQLYAKYKKEIAFESYLDNIKAPQKRRQFTKLRISDHKLEIEVGRHARPKIDRKDRLCKRCSAGDVDDEIHFLISCPDLNNYRNLHIKELINQNNSSENNFIKLIQSVECQSKVANFIYDYTSSASKNK